VGREGRVQAAELARSSGAEDLDHAALAAVRVWRFQPGTRGSSPVEAWVNVPVRFRLER
jgi:protein TonB